eukprot:1158992-Pelagomonas_calceolata.AAC.5
MLPWRAPLLPGLPTPSLKAAAVAPAVLSKRAYGAALQEQWRRKSAGILGLTASRQRDAGSIRTHAFRANASGLSSGLPAPSLPPSSSISAAILQLQHTPNALLHLSAMAQIGELSGVAFILKMEPRAPGSAWYLPYGPSWSQSAMHPLLHDFMTSNIGLHALNKAA